MRQPELLVEDHHEGDGLRPELHGGGPQRVGGLQRMAALHPASTHRAASDPDSKAAHDRVHDRQLFLILHCHAGRRHGAGAVGTRRRHRNGDHLIDTRRWRSVTVAPMPCPASAPAAPRRRRRRALREGGGLAFACPARQVEFVLQPVVLAAQPVALVFQPGTLAFRPLQVPPQPIDSSFKLTDGGVTSRSRPSLHAEPASAANASRRTFRGDVQDDVAVERGVVRAVPIPCRCFSLLSPEPARPMRGRGRPSGKAGPVSQIEIDGPEIGPSSSGHATITTRSPCRYGRTGDA